MFARGRGQEGVGRGRLTGGCRVSASQAESAQETGGGGGGTKV